MRSPLTLASLSASLLVGLLAGGCDDGASAGAPSIDACSMDLRGPGVHTVARYDDGFLLLANAHVALREHERGVIWTRLDGSGSGRLDLTTGSAPLEERSLTLLGPDHLILAGRTATWDTVFRLFELGTGEVLFEGDSIEIRSTWLLDEAGVLWTWQDDRRIPTGCVECRLRAVDGFDRAWVHDPDADVVHVVDLATGALSEVPGIDGWSLDQAGPGIITSNRSRDRIAFGSTLTPIRCASWSIGIATDGSVFCLGDQGRPGGDQLTPVTIHGPDGRELRRAEVPRPWRFAVFGDAFLTFSQSSVTRIPLDPAAPVETLEGEGWVQDEVLLLEAPSEARVMHPDGRLVRLGTALGRLSNVVIARGGRFGLFTVDDARVLVDLERGEEVARIPLEGWARFAGDVLLHDGAPIGESPPPNLSNIVFPDSHCPATLMEQCIGTDCVLAVVEYRP